MFDNHLGRLRYYNLDQTIMAALQTVEREFENKQFSLIFFATLICAYVSIVELVIELNKWYHV